MLYVRRFLLVSDYDSFSCFAVHTGRIVDKSVSSEMLFIESPAVLIWNESTIQIDNMDNLQNILWITEVVCGKKRFKIEAVDFLLNVRGVVAAV